MKGYCKFTIMVLSLVVFCSVGIAQTLTPDQVLKKMEQVNASTPMLQANIQRTKHIDLTGTTDDPQSGKVWVSQSGSSPRQVKVDFTKPLREIFLVSKGSVLHYNPGQKTGDEWQVKKDDQAEGECVLFGLCQPGPRIKQFYDVSVVGQEPVNGSKTTHLRMQPKDPKHPAGITSIELWLDNTTWYTVQTRITEKNKNTVTSSFSNFQTTKIPGSEFDIDTKGADITKHK